VRIGYSLVSRARAEEYQIDEEPDELGKARLDMSVISINIRGLGCGVRNRSWLRRSICLIGS